MEQKTRLGILAAILLVVVVGGIGVVYFQQKKTVVPTQVVKSIDTNAKPKQQVAPPTETPKSYQEAQPDMKTVTVTGKVTAVSVSSIEVANGEVKNTFPLTAKVMVIALSAGKSQSKTLADIKKDDAVTIVINAANSEVVGIQIGNGA